MGHLRDVWVGVCRRGLHTLTMLKTKSVHFATLNLYFACVLRILSSFFFFHFPYRKYFFLEMTS